MDPREVLTRTTDGPDVVLRYADHADGLIDLHLPPSTADEAPLVVFIHGGFWRAEFDRTHTRPLANALAAQGFVVATPEYRRVGGAGELGGGWPTTFDDITAAMGAIPGFLGELGVSTTRPTVAGHSAGGHLALWLANEHFEIDRVVALAPVGDLRAAARDHTGRDAARDLLGGSPDEIPERYDAADPAARLANRPACEVVILHGTDDDLVPVESSRGLASRFPFIDFHELNGIEHFSLIDPLSPAWPTVLSALRDRAK